MKAAEAPRWGVAITGVTAALIGGFWLVAWWAGYAARWSAAGTTITMKTNMALGLVLAGTALILLGLRPQNRECRWAGLAMAAIILLLGSLLLSQHIVGWDLGIDQLLAKELPGAVATIRPNRVGVPGSSSHTLLGIALLLLGMGRYGGRGRRSVPYLGLAVILINLIPAVGYLYGIDQFFKMPATGVAWPTVLTMLGLGLGLVLACPKSGPMVLLLREDAGGNLLRNMLPVTLLLPPLLGYLRTLGEQHGLYDVHMGRGLVVLSLMLVFSLMLWVSAGRLSRADRQHKQGVEALRSAHERTESILACITDAHILWDHQWRFIYINEAAVRSAGRPREQILGRSLWELYPDTIGTEFERSFRHAMEERVPVVFEYHYPGTQTWWETRLYPVSGGLSAFSTDITERKHTEEQLRRAAAFDEAALKSLGEGLYTVDDKGLVTSMNPAAEELFGWTFAELRGRKMHDLTHHHYRDGRPFPASECAGFLVLTSGQPLKNHEDVFIRKDGTFFDVIYSIAPLRDAEGMIAGLVVVFSDISERKRREQEVQRLNRTLQTLSNSSHAMGRARQETEYLTEVCRMVVEDCGHAMVWVGYAEADEQRTVRPVAWAGFEDGYLETLRITWADTERGRGPTGTAIRTGEVSVCRSILTDPRLAPWRSDAVRRGYQSSIALPLVIEGRGFGALMIYCREADPFTEREVSLLTELAGDLSYGIEAIRLREAGARAAVELRQAKETAEGASKAKDHFIAVLSHELRNPLNPVLATVSMLQKDARFDADTREQLEVIHRNVELEARLIDDLLDVTRIERGKIELDRRPIELCTIIHRAAEVCLPDIEARRLEFGIDLGPAPYWVEADAARLQQVFWNLIKNAIKFTPVGGCVGIRCRLEDGHVVAEVNDSGEGIAPEVLPRLFSAFEQGGRPITRQFGGLGLGLTISKAMVEMHGGTICAESAGKGHGATFTVRLPISPLQPAEQREFRPPAETPPQRSRLKILMVEDHGDTARIMSRLLGAEGHSVTHAGDVATALELAGQEHFDVLLSDLGLPDGSGHDLMRRLVASGKRLPAIALSGYGMAADIQQSRDAGFAEHVTKPVNIETLKQALARVTRP